MYKNSLKDQMQRMNYKIVVLFLFVVVFAYSRQVEMPFNLISDTSPEAGEVWLKNRMNLTIDFDIPSIYSKHDAKDLFARVQIEDQVLYQSLTGQHVIKLNFSNFIIDHQFKTVFVEIRKRTLLHELNGEIIATSSFVFDGDSRKGDSDVGYDVETQFVLEPDGYGRGLVKITYMDEKAPVVQRLSVDYTDEFNERYEKYSKDADIDGFLQIYPSCKNYHYLLVKGFFCDYYGPAYFKHNREILDKLGLEHSTCKINTQQTMEVNAGVIADTVEALHNQGKKIVIISHSKGGGDVEMAYIMYPKVMELVEGFVSMQGTWGGVFMPELLEQFELDKILGEILHILGGNKSTITQMGHPYIAQKLIDHISDVPSPNVKSVSFGSWSYFNDTGGLFGPIVEKVMIPLSDAVSFGRGYLTDGLVAYHDSIVEGSRTIRVEGCSHADPTFAVKGAKIQPGPLTETLLSILFDDYL